MPNCKYQKLKTLAVDGVAGFEILTNEYGLLEVLVVTVGNTTTISCFKDSILQQAPTVINATPSAVETLITNFLNGIVVGVVNGPQHTYIACHVVTVNPFLCNLMSANGPISGTWWVRGGI